MRKAFVTTFAIYVTTFAGAALAQPTVLHADAVEPQHLAEHVQAKRAFHIPPMPLPLPPRVDPTPGPPGPPSNGLATFLATVAIPDLQNALAIANAQTPPDITAAQCWSGLIPIVQQIQAQLPNTNGSTPFGLATAVQIARDFINAPTSPVIKQVNLACAALYMDTKIGIVNFAANFSGMLAGAAILAPIKPIPIP